MVGLSRVFRSLWSLHSTFEFVNQLGFIFVYELWCCEVFFLSIFVSPFDHSTNQWIIPWLCRNVSIDNKITKIIRKSHQCLIISYFARFTYSFIFFALSISSLIHFLLFSTIFLFNLLIKIRNTLHCLFGCIILFYWFYVAKRARNNLSVSLQFRVNIFDVRCAHLFINCTWYELKWHEYFISVSS